MLLLKMLEYQPRYILIGLDSCRDLTIALGVFRQWFIEAWSAKAEEFQEVQWVLHDEPVGKVL